MKQILQMRVRANTKGVTQLKKFAGCKAKITADGKTRFRVMPKRGYTTISHNAGMMQTIEIEIDEMRRVMPGVSVLVLCMSMQGDTTKCACSNCMHSSNNDGVWACGMMVQKSRIPIHASSYCCWHEPLMIIPMQDPATKCTDPSDKDAVIRDLRIEKNGLLCIINSIRKDAEAAHRHIEYDIGNRGKELSALEALDALENIIESMGVQP